MYDSKNILLRRLTTDLSSILNKAMDLSSPFSLFQDYLEREGVKVIESKFEKINEYVQLLMKKNEVLNLTTITSEEEVWVKHVFDALIPVRYLKIEKGTKVLDLGTGGGIPGILLAILFPSAHFTLVDSVQKKAEAVREFAKELGLKNVKVLSERSEDLAHESEHREEYDLVVARAFAPLRVLVELAIPFIHPYGIVGAYKGPEYLQELSDARDAIIKLKAQPPKIHYYELPMDMGKRTFFTITKKEPVPDLYPRRAGVPNKRPL